MPKLQEFHVYRDGVHFKDYRVNPASIMAILRQLSRVHAGEFKAVSGKEVYFCK